MSAKPAGPPKGQPSSATPTVKPICRIDPTATVADKAQLTGSYTIEIGQHAIIHPYAKLRADHGHVTIGPGCIVSEKAVVGVAEAGDEETDVVIGEGVNIESGAVVEARKVGEYTTIGINAKVGRGAVLGRWCKTVPLSEVKVLEVLEDYTVVFGDGQSRRVDGVTRDRKEVRDAKLKGMELEREALRGVLTDSKMKWIT